MLMDPFNSHNVLMNHSVSLRKRWSLFKKLVSKKSKLEKQKKLLYLQCKIQIAEWTACWLTLRRMIIQLKSQKPLKTRSNCQYQGRTRGLSLTGNYTTLSVSRGLCASRCNFDAALGRTGRDLCEPQRRRWYCMGSGVVLRAAGRCVCRCPRRRERNPKKQRIIDPSRVLLMHAQCLC